MAKKTNENLVRVNMNLPSHIVERIKEYADSLGINVTSAYIVLLNQALEQKDMLLQLPMLMSSFNDIKNMKLLEGLNDKLDN